MPLNRHGTKVLKALLISTINLVFLSGLEPLWRKNLSKWIQQWKKLAANNNVILINYAVNNMYICRNLIYRNDKIHLPIRPMATFHMG